MFVWDVRLCRLLLAGTGGSAVLSLDRSREVIPDWAAWRVLDDTRTPIVLADMQVVDAPIVFVNQAFCRQTGYEAGEVLGRNCRFLQGDLTDRGAIAKIRAALRHGYDIEIELINHRKDGTPFVNDLCIRMLRDEAGVVRYALGSQIDRTQFREVQRALLGNEDRQKAWLERLSEGFVLGEIMTDASGRAVDWRFLELNRAWEEITGRGRAATLGRTARETIPEIMPRWLQDFEAVVRSGAPRTVTHRVASVARWFEARIYRPEPGRFAVLFRDVTEERHRVLRQQVLGVVNDVIREEVDPEVLMSRVSEIVGQAFGVSRVGYGRLDRIRGCVEIVRDWVAPGFASLAGTMQGDACAGSVPALMRGEVVAIVDVETDSRARVEALRAIGVRAVLDLAVTEKDGVILVVFLHHRGVRKWAEGEIALIREVAERVRVAVGRCEAERGLRELTAVLEAKVEGRTRALMAVEEELRQSQKMEAIGHLTGGIAHDFNNLLTGISGALELMGGRIAAGRVDGVGRYLDAARGAARRAAALTHRLLAFSRRQTLAPRAVDLNSLVRDMEDLIVRSVGPSIVLEVMLQEGVWPILIDANQFENALLNLCINARDAMPEGGTLLIVTENIVLGEEAGGYDLLPGAYVRLEVRDTGTGMTREVIDHAFDPFFTTKPVGVGTGLGLSTMYGFVRQSGGQARIASTLGGGTCISLILPRSFGGVDEEMGVPVASARVGAGRILVVDDEAVVRMLMADALTEAGYEVMLAGDGAEALSRVRGGGRLDLLVTDIGLPGGLNGRQVAEAVRVEQPGVPVLFVTGYAEHTVLGQGALGSGFFVQTKPFALDRLVERVGEIVRHVPAERAV